MTKTQWASGSFQCMGCTHAFSVKKIKERQQCPACASFDLRRKDAPNFILKGTGWAGKHTSTPVNTEEKQLLHKIQHAAMTDADIADVQTGDNHTLKKEMMKKTNELHREKKMLDRDYGKDVFDGKDATGQLVKLMDFKPSEDGAIF